MTGSLEKLQRKYDAPGACGPGKENVADRRAAGTAEEPEGWRGCPEIVALRDYLAAHPELGAKVGLCGEKGLSVRFSPPIGAGQVIQTAFEAAALLLDAKPEILRRVAAGEMKLRRFE